MVQNQNQPQKTDIDSKVKVVRLDAVIQQVSYDLAQAVKKEKKGNELEKAMGVLAQDGLYAFYVFCESKKIWSLFNTNLKSLSSYQSVGNVDKGREYFEKVSDNLYDMLFVKDLFDKMLVYTRYHLKAMGTVEEE